MERCLLLPQPVDLLTLKGLTGFQMGAFSVECDALDLADVTAVTTTVKRALAIYGTAALKDMSQNCMAQDLSWKGPAKKWEQMLLSLEVAGSEPGIEGEEIAPLAKENVATPLALSNIFVSS